MTHALDRRTRRNSDLRSIDPATFFADELPAYADRHGPLVTDGEVEAVVRHCKAQGVPDYDEAITDESGAEGGGPAGAGDPGQGGLFGEGGGDAVYRQAVQIVARDGKAAYAGHAQWNVFD